MILLLNGSINAGKSTVARLLAKALPNAALLEIDALREMIAWMPIDKAVPVNLENAVSVIRNFVKRGLDGIVNYSALGPNIFCGCANWFGLDSYSCISHYRLGARGNGLWIFFLHTSRKICYVFRTSHVGRYYLFLGTEPFAYRIALVSMTPFVIIGLIAVSLWRRDSKAIIKIV